MLGILNPGLVIACPWWVISEIAGSTPQLDTLVGDLHGCPCRRIMESWARKIWSGIMPALWHGFKNPGNLARNHKIFDRSMFLKRTSVQQDFLWRCDFSDPTHKRLLHQERTYLLSSNKAGGYAWFLNKASQPFQDTHASLWNFGTTEALDEGKGLILPHVSQLAFVGYMRQVALPLRLHTKADGSCPMKPRAAPAVGQYGRIRYVGLGKHHPLIKLVLSNKQR